MRVEYAMTQADLDALKEAARPVPLIALQCGMPMSPQEKANALWRQLADQMGFRWDTVRPAEAAARAWLAAREPARE